MEKEAKNRGTWGEMLSKDPGDRDLLLFVFGFVTGIAPLTIIALALLYIGRYQSYSLGLTAVDGFSQSAGGPPLSPAFNLTLYVKNSHMLAESCFSHGQVALSYDGVAMGEGRVPGWCAGPRSTAEVKVVARGHDVQLPYRLRKRMEAELRWGSAELDVEAKLFGDDETQSPVLLWCKAVGPQVPPQPLQCKAFTELSTS